MLTEIGEIGLVGGVRAYIPADSIVNCMYVVYWVQTECIMSGRGEYTFSAVYTGLYLPQLCFKIRSISCHGNASELAGCRRDRVLGYHFGHIFNEFVVTWMYAHIHTHMHTHTHTHTRTRTHTHTGQVLAG